MDEQQGRTVASTEGTTTKGTAYLLFRTVKRGDLPADEAREVVDELVETSWYCSPDLYAKILQKLDEFT